MKYWLWIIPIGFEGLDDLWDFCLREGVAAMQYEIGVDKRAEFNREIAQQIEIGDKVVAYLNQNRVGGVGTVTRPFFDDSTGYRSGNGLAFGQRIGVNWQPAEGDPIDIRQLPRAVHSRDQLVLVGKTIHPIDQAAFEQIAQAVKMTRENPLPKIADLLESVSLDDAACKDGGLWVEQIQPITRPFFEYVGGIIKSGILVHQSKDIKLTFKNKPRDVKKLATTRDSVGFQFPNTSCSLVVYCGSVLQGFRERFVWGSFWWGKNDIAPAIEKEFNGIKSDGETVTREADPVFGGTYCALFKGLTVSELKQAHPVELAHRISVDWEHLYKRLETTSITRKRRKRKRRKRTMDVITEFMTFAGDHGFHFPSHLVTSYFLSLQTKPFVILTGISGTGKTKLAQLFAEWMSTTTQVPSLAFISVRPDWMDNRGLLGFYNLIACTYQTTDFLRLLVQATFDVTSPYFVVLDEMNLAKVEHYFADFLSVLESRYLREGELEQSSLRLHDLPRCVLAQGESPWGEEAELGETGHFMCRVRCDGCPLHKGVSKQQQSRGESDYDEAHKAGFDPTRYVPPRLYVPCNVYFSGTVNVDETTYMFSPKVLDRANTIEFNEVDLEGYFTREPSSNNVVSASDAVRATFTFDGKFILLPKAVPIRTEERLAPYREKLIALNKLLQPFNMHFGYRVVDEILLYLWNAWKLNDSTFDLNIAFDHQLCQKVLPKFHGSRAKLQEPLDDLLLFCLDDVANHQRISEVKGKSVESLRLEKVPYPYATHKIRQMLDALEKEGFASFA